MCFTCDAQANDTLRAQLAAAQKALEKASKQGKSESSKGSTATPKAKSKRVAKSKGKDPTPPHSENDPEEDEQEEQEEQESEEEQSEKDVSEGAKLGRLRRLCERKPSGKLRVPEDIHQMWAKGGHSRQKLLQMLEEAGFKDDPSKNM